MKKRPRTLLKCGAGLTDGLMTVGSDAGCLPRGGIRSKAQSEREKRDPRHSDLRVASSSRPSGGSHPTRWANSDGSAPASKIVGGIGTNPAILAGLVVLCLLLKLSPASKI